MAAAPRSNALRVALAVAAGAGVAAAVPRTASACSCIARGAYLQSPRPGGASSAALPLLIAAPTDADIHLEDEAGRALASRGVLFLPTLGLCNMPWFLVGPDGGPWPPGTYRLVRGPDNADTFQLTATGVAAVPATLSMTLSIETIDPITPDGAGC
jgi:hypothetical protein